MVLNFQKSPGSLWSKFRQATMDSRSALARVTSHDRRLFRIPFIGKQLTRLPPRSGWMYAASGAADE
jgi:hypothetical protein